MSEHEPPPDELKDLFDAERTAPAMDPSSRTALRSRLVAAIGGTPLGHAAAGTAFGGLSKALAIVVVTVAAGTGTVALVKHVRADGSAEIESTKISPSISASRETPPVGAKPPVGPPKPVAPPAELTLRRDVPRVPVVSSEPRPSALPTKKAELSQPDMLRMAWTALASGEAERALDIVNQDARLHPEGVLEEEREVVEVVALAKLGRANEASVAASRFLERHPASIHRALVERSTRREDNP